MKERLKKLYLLIDNLFTLGWLIGLIYWSLACGWIGCKSNDPKESALYFGIAFCMSGIAVRNRGEIFK